MHETNIFRDFWSRVSKLFFHWNSKFQQSNNQYFVFNHFFEQYVIILWKFYNVRIDAIVNFDYSRVRIMRMIVTFDSNCIFLQKWKNEKRNFEFDSIRQKCRTNQLSKKFSLRKWQSFNKLDFIDDDDNHHTSITDYLWHIGANHHIHVLLIWKNKSQNNISIK